MSPPGQDPQDPQAPVLPGGVQPADPALVTNALLWAIQRAAEDSAAANDPRETQELGAAALAFAQAVIVLDPSLSQGGTPLEHDLALEQLRGETQVRVAQVSADAQLRQAREAAQAPTPAKRREVTARPGAQG